MVFVTQELIKEREMRLMDNTEELLQESDFRFVSDNEEEAEIVYERSVFKNLKKNFTFYTINLVYFRWNIYLC